MEYVENGSCLFVNIWVTRLCNLNCSYCYEGEHKEDYHISIKLADIICSFIINHLKNLDINDCFINFHGGEPLLNFEAIKSIVENLNKSSFCKFSYTFTTNATILTDEILNFLISNFSSISVSLDGNIESHDSNRKFANQEGSFYIAFRNSMRFKDIILVRVRMTVTPENVSNLAQNIIFLLENGFNSIVPVMDFFSDKWNKMLMETFKSQLNIVKNYLLNNKISTNRVSFVDNSSTIGKLGVCSGGKYNITIDANGDLYPCSYSVGDLTELIGNVFTGIHCEKLNSFNDMLIKDVEKCRGCQLYLGCTTSRCKFINKRLTGDYLNPSANICAFERLKI